MEAPYFLCLLFRSLDNWVSLGSVMIVQPIEVLGTFPSTLSQIYALHTL